MTTNPIYRLVCCTRHCIFSQSLLAYQKSMLTQAMTFSQVFVTGPDQTETVLQPLEIMRVHMVQYEEGAVQLKYFSVSN